MALIKRVLQPIVLFGVMALVAQWMMINLYLSSLGQTQQLLTEIKISPLLDFVQAKTGLKLNSFRIIASPRLYALMVGLPGKPYMVLSSTLDQKFSMSEREYIVLHEVGHYVGRHTMIEIFAFIILFILGLWVIRKLHLWLVPIVGVILALGFIQVGARYEYEADHFALKRMTDPNGMITATAKFKAQQIPRIDDRSIMWKLLLRSTPYYERENLANEEIQARKKGN